MTPSFTAQRKALLDAVRTVVPAVGRVPYNGVRLAISNGQLWVEATDLDLALQAPVTAGSVTQGEANIVIPSRRLLTVLSLGLAGEDVVATWPAKDGDRVVLSSGLASAWIDTLSADEWPGAHSEVGGVLVLTAEDIASIKSVSASASTDDARPILSAVCLADGFATATDSYRLSAARISTSPTSTLLLPANAVRVLPDEGVTLTIGSAGVQWGGPMAGGWSRVIDGDFPNWQGLMPTPAYSVVFDRDGLIGAVGRAEALIGHSGIPMLIEKAAGGVRLGARDGVGDLFAETMGEAEADDGCPGVAVNPRLLVSLLRSFTSRRVRVGVTDALRPLLITADDGDPEAFRSLLMPVRTEWSSKVRAA